MIELRLARGRDGCTDTATVLLSPPFTHPCSKNQWQVRSHFTARHWLYVARTKPPSRPPFNGFGRADGKRWPYPSFVPGSTPRRTCTTTSIGLTGSLARCSWICSWVHTCPIQLIIRAHLRVARYLCYSPLLKLRLPSSVAARSCHRLRYDMTVSLSLRVGLLTPYPFFCRTLTPEAHNTSRTG